MEPASFKKKETIKKCLWCEKVINGRSDKKYCDDSCRNNYNNNFHQYERINYRKKYNEVLAERDTYKKKHEDLVVRHDALINFLVTLIEVRA